jgi:ring-1,2-phenylacetyl-CoA epoxidase subunit PaaC
MRDGRQFHNCIFVELPNGEYDFSLMRHFLYDTAMAIRFELLSDSSFEPLKELSLKIRGELKYHTLHANTWIRQLGSATSESVNRLQQSLQQAMPYAIGMFEESPYETELIEQRIFSGEKILRLRWQNKVEEVLQQTQLRPGDWGHIQPVNGGRRGEHSEHLQPLLNEMSEVFKIDPSADW